MTISKWALRLWTPALAVSMLVATPALLYSAPNPGNSFFQHNLVSDLPGMAYFTDSSLVNPWGVSFAPTSPLWVSDNGTGLSTLYNGAGVKQGLVVTIPPAGAAAPTGQVFNNTGDFGGAHFIFATEGGTITSWTGGTSAVLNYTSPIGAVYKGLALGSVGSLNFLYAADFHNNGIDVFNKNFAPSAVSGTFTDPNLPSGYAPFNIQSVGNRLYVTYAVQDAAKHDDVAGPGNGILDVFDTDGNFIQRLVSNGGALNSPWGMAWAPAGFGKFGGDLLVGNFGDGTINVFDPATGMWLAQLDDPSGNPLTNLGLWAIVFGNTGAGSSPNTLYFTAGIPGPDNVEDHGLFGTFTATPEPGTLTLLGSGLASLLGYGWRKGKRSA